MALCVDKHSLEYQTLLQRSGVPDFNLNVVVSYYLENYGRYPRLNEIPNADSRAFMYKQLDVKVNNSDLKGNKTEEESSIQSIKVSKNKIIEYLGLNSDASNDVIQDLMAKKHTDLTFKDVKVSKDGKTYIFKFYKLPTQWSRRNVNRNLMSNEEQEEFSVEIFNKFIEEAFTKFGRRVIKISDLELSTPEWKGIVDTKKINKAFIYEGNIYINTDHATIDDMLHELLHVYIGAVQTKDSKNNTDLYKKMLNTIIGSGQFEQRWNREVSINKNTKMGNMMDFAEEVLVSELAKHLTGQQSIFRGMDQKLMDDISYTLKTGLDSIFYANGSATSMSDINFFTSSLKDVLNYLKSGLLEECTYRNIDYDAYEHRITSNIMQKMLNNNMMEEQCNG